MPKRFDNMSSEVQSIGFYKPPIGEWNKPGCERWLNSNSYIPINGCHETENMYHYKINEPSIGKKNVYSKYISKPIFSGGKKILMTVGVGKRCENPNNICGGCCRCTSDMHGGMTRYVSEWDAEPGYLTSYPLSKESSILKSVISEEEYHKPPDRGLLSKDLGYETIEQNKDSSLTNSLIPNFGPDTLLGALLKPASQGGIGFPFPVSMSTFSPSAYR